MPFYLRLIKKMTQNKTILLITDKLGKYESLSLILQQSGYKVLFAGDGREGFRLIRRESPDLVISEMNLSGISALELCRMIREDRELWATPLIFVSESHIDNKSLVEMLDAGADECLAEFSNPQYLTTKAEWLIKRKYSENYLIHHYEILRSRQQHIAEIIKGTANLFSMSDLDLKATDLNKLNGQVFRKNLSQRIDLGMNMISSLANLLEEQVNTLETWGRSRRVEDFAASQESESEKSELSYEYINYDLIDNNLPAHFSK